MCLLWLGWDLGRDPGSRSCYRPFRGSPPGSLFLARKHSKRTACQAVKNPPPLLLPSSTSLNLFPLSLHLPVQPSNDAIFHHLSRPLLKLPHTLGRPSFHPAGGSCYSQQANHPITRPAPRFDTADRAPGATRWPCLSPNHPSVYGRIACTQHNAQERMLLRRRGEARHTLIRSHRQSTSLDDADTGIPCPAIRRRRIWQDPAAVFGPGGL